MHAAICAGELINMILRSAEVLAYDNAFEANAFPGILGIGSICG